MQFIITLILFPWTLSRWVQYQFFLVTTTVIYHSLHLGLHILMMVISRVQFRLTGTSVTSCVICLGGGKPAPTTAIRPLQLTREGDDASQAVRQPVQSALEWRRRRRKTRQQRGREGGGGDPRRQSIETPPVLPSPGSSRTCRPKFWRKAKKLRKKKVQRHEKRPLSACCLTGTTTSSSFGLPTSTCASEPYWDGMELCELHIYPEEDQWPPDIDSRIAALNFGGDSVLFESFDPSVSTDSLDSQQLREQCTIRRDDFQLAFADSGHWQSGLNETGNITTWGRIRSAEPLEERTASAPDVTKTSVTTNTTTNRPTSLIANFVANNDTRFVDLNDNEIETTRETSSELDEAIRKDRWRRSTASQRSLPTRRTFADLEPPTSSGSGSGSSGTKTAPPPLEFLALNHEIPSLCESFTTSFRDVLMKTPKVEGLPGITDLDDMNLDNTPDSGISCSGPSHIEDWASLSVLLPKHVAQACSFFKSNAQLLVSTSSSITAAPHAPVVHKTSNCIDSACSNQRKLTEPCRTCYRIRRRLHPPLWAQTQTSKTFLCDCLSSVTESQIKATGTSNTRHCLRPKELSIIGMPVYAMKRALIERVVEGVAAVSRGECPDSLVASMTEVISDGLLGHVSCWQMIKTVTSKGPATKDIFTTVKQLSDSNKSETVCVEIFFERLIRENSLDCWLCYVVLKEKALQKLYKEDAFLVSASGEYRTLLWRMVDSLALLPILETRDTTSQVKSLHETGGASRLASDSRVPKSSSVPARLSVSAATTSRRVIRPSRIPLLSRRDNSSSRVSTSSATNSASLSSLLATSQLAYVVEPVHETSNFDLEKDEKVRVLSCRDGMARCCRVHPKALQLCTGIVPVDKLSFVKNAH